MNMLPAYNLYFIVLVFHKTEYLVVSINLIYANPLMGSEILMSQF